MKLLVVDNHDSFTWNLVHLLARVGGAMPDVVLNDAPALPDLDQYDGIVISPGPGTPEEPADLGHSAAVLASDRPVLGVCLGMQAMVQASGGRVGRARRPVHGEVHEVRHDGRGVFAGLPATVRAVRYHSLVAVDLPDALVATAWCDGEVMAVRHRARPWVGLQFHPESVETPVGEALVAAWLRALGARPQLAPVPSDAAPAPVAGRGAPVRFERSGPADPEAVYCALFADSRASFWLDGGGSRWSFLGDADGPTGAVMRYDVGGELIVDDADGRLHAPGPFLRWLRSRWRDVRHDAVVPVPFDLGLVGTLGYELRDELGSEVSHRAPTPDALFLVCDRAVAIDHERGETWLLWRDDGDPDRQPWLERARAALAAEVPALSTASGGALAVQARHDGAAYLARIAACQAAIRDGEAYELCLTNTVSSPECLDPLQAYRHLRRANPGAHGALLMTDEIAVLSCSPERFLRVDRAGRVEARPIKGTAARAPGIEEDATQAASLRGSAKERAENLMIVDLLRNDLARVCDVGSVTVPARYAVESLATVHQLVSVVEGKLRDDCDAVDLIASAFPGGSMTGAPKERAMALLDAPRGRPQGHLQRRAGLLRGGGRGRSRHRHPHGDLHRGRRHHRHRRRHHGAVGSGCGARRDRAQDRGDARAPGPGSPGARGAPSGIRPGV